MSALVRAAWKDQAGVPGMTVLSPRRRQSTSQAARIRPTWLNARREVAQRLAGRRVHLLGQQAEIVGEAQQPLQQRRPDQLALGLPSSILGWEPRAGSSSSARSSAAQHIALEEGWFSKLKERLVWRSGFETLEKARAAIAVGAAYVVTYEHRPHPGIGYRTRRR